MSARTSRVLLPILTLSVYFVGSTEFMLSSMLSPLASAFKTSLEGAAWLVSSYACAYALAAPLFGYLSDRIDRRRLLLLALLFFAVDAAGVTFAPSLAVAMVLRIFGGIASAILIPSAFALISEVVERESQARAMGLVMLGMTFGIAFGPALAGILTDRFGWQAPFLVTCAGCMITFSFGLAVIPRNLRHADIRAEPLLSWFRDWSVLRPLIAKGAWNGTGVAAYLLSGQVLQQRYGFGAAEVGLSVTAFGIGLGIGNLSAGWLRRVCGREEISLIVVTLLAATAISLFMLAQLPLTGSLACLACWGAALGAGAPSSTVVLAARARTSKAIVLAFAETFNNVAILCIVPFATAQLVESGPRSAMAVLAAGLCLGSVLTLFDASVSRGNPEAAIENACAEDSLSTK